MRKPVPFAQCVAYGTLFLVGVLTPVGRPLFGVPVVMAQEGWKAEYESVCSKTDVAMTLSITELQELISRCDRLKPRIEAEEESTRKVYLRRLQMCRDLYRYVLHSKGPK